jgi:predicted nucleotidyltransferase component of viral defense system
MSLFDQWVDEALKNRSDLAPLRIVVEKELLHYDILQTLSSAGLLAKLTFIGGTCLRACYGSNRLSEDLDFTGGKNFNRKTFSLLSKTLVDNLKAKYGLDVIVTEPTREIGNVSTWKLKIQKRPGKKDQPAQRINIDICSIPSYEPRPMMLLNNYRLEMGTSGLILQAESREEILADKMVAFALRANRIKHRDLWDIVWLHQQGVKLPVQLVKLKLKDHHCKVSHFLSSLHARQKSLKNNPQLFSEFQKEMHRFLPSELIAGTIKQAAFWSFLTNLMDDLDKKIHSNFH